MVKGMFKKKVPFTYKNVFIRDGYSCQYCGSKQELTIDHVVPRSRGGKSNFENCVTACRPCNNSKGNKELHHFGIKLRRQPKVPTLMEFLDYKLKASGIKEILREFWEEAQ